MPFSFVRDCLPARHLVLSLPLGLLQCTGISEHELSGMTMSQAPEPIVTSISFHPFSPPSSEETAPLALSSFPFLQASRATRPPVPKLPTNCRSIVPATVQMLTPLELACQRRTLGILMELIDLILQRPFCWTPPLQEPNPPLEVPSPIILCPPPPFPVWGPCPKLSLPLPLLLPFASPLLEHL